MVSKVMLRASAFLAGGSLLVSGLASAVADASVPVGAASWEKLGLVGLSAVLVVFLVVKYLPARDAVHDKALADRDAAHQKALEALAAAFQEELARGRKEREESRQAVSRWILQIVAALAAKGIEVDEGG